MTEEIPPHVRGHMIGQRLKSMSRLTTAYYDHARGIVAAIAALKEAHDGMQDAALKIRCSFTDPAVPSEAEVNTAIGTEVMRVLGVATKLFMGVDIATTLGSPGKVAPLDAVAYETAAALNAALSKSIETENNAASRSISLALSTN